MRSLRNAGRQKSAVALVIVLGAIALILVLAVGFLGRVSSERSSAASYQAGVSSRTLADSAMSIAQAQIDIGTKQGTGKTWTSQPGLLRVFDASGAMTLALKLYSSPQMSASTVDIAQDVPTDDSWLQKPALWVDLNEPVTSGSQSHYPILDPSAASTTSATAPLGAVQGFSLPSSKPAAQGVRMPVRWLYVLQDGEVVSPASESSGVLTFDSSVVNAANPIAGRIAFWTDDDSCKVNLNTAGEGVYWDVPRYMTLEEQILGRRQPAQNEFNRYPGHPATTSLSTVFPNLTTAQILNSQFLPRYGWGGSLAGTAIATQPVPLRRDRLFASVSEAGFKPDRQASIVDRTGIESRNFFLTAHSRAPETNLHNLPRVAIWPLHVTDDERHRTAFDRQVARCATINGKPYFFQRENALSPTSDLANISRNLQIYDYLVTLMATPIPGFGGNFRTKYGDPERRQILTEIFDYIRSSNLIDPLLEKQSDGVPYTPKADTSTSVHSMVEGYGSAAPIRHPTNGTMGFGRFYTLAEFALHFMCTGEAGTPTAAPGPLNNNIPPNGIGGPANANLTLATNTALATGEKRIMAAVHLRLFSPAQGWVTMQPAMTVELEDLDGFRLNTQPLFPPSANGRMELGRKGPDAGHLGSAYGGNAGTGFPLFSKRMAARGNLPADPAGTNAEDLYPFISDPVTIAAASGTMTFSGGPVRVKIFSGNSRTGTPELVQTINLTVPNGSFPIPNLPMEPPGRYLVFPFQAAPGYSAQYWWSPGQRGAVPSLESRGRLHGAARGEVMITGEGSFRAGTGGYFHENDVVRSLVLKHGDHRLTAAREEVPANEFVAHPDWGINSVRFASHLYNDLPYIYWPPASTTGVYVNGSTFLQNYARPDIPRDRDPNMNIVTTRDWDQSTARGVDGPYINKADEGNTYDAGFGPYMYGANITGSAGFTFFSPNRQMPSPGVFGSLPTQLKANTPWRTLLFRPQAATPVHPSSGIAPKDHLLMDLFWMPVVEPYAISEPFSTAGKINMNFQIIPFTSIDRRTGMFALLKGEKLGAVPVGESNLHKNKDSLTAATYRKEINIPETLKQFDQRFGPAGADVFRSATEICDLWIVPKGQSLAGMPDFWTQHRMTGENVRERIYTTLYPRLTVRSNTFTVHFWSQSLKKPIGQPPNQWNEARGTVVGNYRGSKTIERFIDPNNPLIPDYASAPSAIADEPSLNEFYRWRSVSQSEFAP